MSASNAQASRRRPPVPQSPMRWPASRPKAINRKRQYIDVKSQRGRGPTTPAVRRWPMPTSNLTPIRAAIKCQRACHGRRQLPRGRGHQFGRGQCAGQPSRPIGNHRKRQYRRPRAIADETNSSGTDARAQCQPRFSRPIRAASTSTAMSRSTAQCPDPGRMAWRVPAPRPELEASLRRRLRSTATSNSRRSANQLNTPAAAKAAFANANLGVDASSGSNQRQTANIGVNAFAKALDSGSVRGLCQYRSVCQLQH